MHDQFLTKERKEVIHYIKHNGNNIGGLVYTPGEPRVTAFRREGVFETDFLVELVFAMHQRQLPCANLQYERLMTIGGLGGPRKHQFYKITPATS